MRRVSLAAAAMKISGRGDGLESARVVFADPGLVVAEAVQQHHQFEVAFEQKGRVLVQGVERSEKNAEAQHGIGHAGRLASGLRFDPVELHAVVPQDLAGVLHGQLLLHERVHRVGKLRIAVGIVG